MSNASSRATREQSPPGPPSGLLTGVPGHFAETVIREILRLPFFDRLQNEGGNEFRLVAIRVIG
jgi:hypothetical protein